MVQAAWGCKDSLFACEQPGPREQTTVAARRQWREARLFQVRAQKVLAKVGVHFIEWLLLESLHELILERRDAVSQARIAERSGLTRMITSYWMLVLDEKAAIDRGPDQEGRAYRILLSDVGAETLRICNDQLAQCGLLG